MQCLRRDHDIAKRYSDALDHSLGNFSEITDVDDLSNKITESIQVASDSVILKEY